LTQHTQLFRLRNISIRGKLILMQVFTSVIVLGLCFAAFVVSHIKDYKERKVNSMTSLAKVIGANSISTFQFKDNDYAEQILDDLQQVSPEVLNACILDKQQNIFATYTKPGANSFHFILPASNTKKFEFTSNNLFIYSSIINNKDTLGTVCLKTNLNELNDIKTTQYSIALILLVVGVGLSFIIAFVVQRYISRRILKLANVMKEVNETGDYKKHVDDSDKDEISTLAQVFNQMMEQIFISQQKKDEFIGIASHELKTPLTSIKAYLQVLESIEDDDTHKKYINKSLDSVNKLQQLIYDLLDVSKIQSNQLYLNITEFDIDNFIDETIAEFQFVAGGHKILRNGSEINHIIKADRQRLEQVLTNLLSNAAKYSPDSKEIIVYTEERGQELLVRVRDFGFGIAKGELNKIFERFYRTKTNSILISGFGLGLYICKDIIRRHHGKIWAESEDSGTSFYFSLPMNNTIK
jgi:signal transduction histidine kinase